MAKIYYAIEIETNSVIGNNAYGLTYGYFRFITDRPIYTGTETGDALIPTGENSVIKIELNGTQTLSVSLQSGQIYAAANGTFKLTNTVVPVGDRFTVLDTTDFTDGKLATAKGSAPAAGDLFEVTNNGSGTEAIKYVGLNRWYEDFITREGMSNPSRYADLEGSGDYGTLSGFTFRVKDTIIAGTDIPLWKYLATNSINLSNRNVKLYAVIDDSFYLIWSGVVENNPRSETEFIFECNANFKLVHKDIPPANIETTNYPLVKDEVKGEIIPVSIGDIIYADSINVSNKLIWTTIAGSTTSRIEAQATAYVDSAFPSLTLRTVNSIDVNALQGKYLFVLAGEKAVLNKGMIIISNGATVGYETVLYLQESLKDSNGDVFNAATHGYVVSGSTDFYKKWVFAIADIDLNYLYSNSAITLFKKDQYNRVLSFQYDDDNKKYESISKFVNDETVATAIVKIKTNSLDEKSSFTVLDPVHFTLTTSDTNGQYLTDKDRTTYITKEESYLNSLYFEYPVLIEQDFGVAGTLQFGIDFDVLNRTTGLPYAGSVSVRIQGLVGGLGVYDKTIAFTTASEGHVYLLYNKYYLKGVSYFGDTSYAQYYKTDLLLGSEFEGLIKSDYYNSKIRFKITVTLGTSVPIKVNIKEIGFMAQRVYQFDNSKIYTRLSGEKTTGSAETNTVYNAFRLMLETYDGISSANIDYGNLATKRNGVNPDYWHVGKQLTKRKNTADHIKELCEQSFVCAFQNRKGKIALTAWLDREDTAHVHNNTNIIRDSITKWDLTSIDRIFNSFTVNYSLDPVNDKYFSVYHVKNPDQAAWVSGYGQEELWNVCKGCYDVYKCVKEFKIDLTWFIDRSLWYNSSEAGIGLGVDGSAYHWLRNAVYWMTRQKRNAGYNIPLNTTNINIELCDPVTFRDPVYTNSLVDTDYLSGSVYSIEYDIPTDTIRIESILQPNDSIDTTYGDTVETGTAADTITESGSDSDTITEDGN